jgi:hypothetical protein
VVGYFCSKVHERPFIELTLAEDLARTNDPPPGNTIMWRGLSCLTDIESGAIIGAKIVGN